MSKSRVDSRYKSGQVAVATRQEQAELAKEWVAKGFDAIKFGRHGIKYLTS
jgi:hypothetical protein